MTGFAPAPLAACRNVQPVSIRVQIGRGNAENQV